MWTLRSSMGQIDMNTPKAGKIAGVAFVGFIATAFAATKFDFSPATSQLAGFVGAFLGSLVANGRPPKRSGNSEKPATDPKSNGIQSRLS